MKKITIYYACGNDGAGAVYLRWFLDRDKAYNWERNQDEGFGDDCTGEVETFEDSNIYKLALKNEKA